MGQKAKSGPTIYVDGLHTRTRTHTYAHIHTYTRTHTYISTLEQVIVCVYQMLGCGFKSKGDGMVWSARNLG